MISVYREYNERIHNTCCAVFNSINSVLSDLKYKGITLGVVTTKRREVALRWMKLFGLEDLMSVLIGPEDTPGVISK